MRTTRLALTAGTLALASLTAVPAQASTPPASRLGSDNPTASWTGRTLLPAGGVYCPTSDDPLCDNHYIEVTTAGTISVTVSGQPGDDWDVFVYDDDGRLVQSAGGTGSDEVVTFEGLARANYEIDVAPFLVTSGRGYTARATWTP